MKHTLPLLLLAALFCGAPAVSAANSRTTFEIKDGHFYRNNKIISIHSGEFHFARVPHQYWKQRLQMMKALGLNTVATYVFWNFHEETPGKWDFTGDKDLRLFIKTAQELGMMVILRPGPYACAEWEFGGFPWWIQNVKDIKIREDNPAFLKYTQLYFDRLYKEVGDLQCTKGGPVIMLQAENEFGSFAAQRPDIPLEAHKRYVARIAAQIRTAGFDVPTFTSDGSWLFKQGTVPGALPTANGETNIANLKKVVNEYHDGKGPYMVAEFYPGWLDHWGEPFQKVSATSIARQTEAYLKNDVSFNLYMVYGGTNYGFMSGANYDKKRDIQPDLTSYDYAAPISEAGWRTEKFDSIRTVMQKYSKTKLPEVPAAIPVIDVPAIRLDKAGNLLAYAETLPAKTNDTPLTFEQLNQGYGYVLYSRHFTQPISGTLSIPGLRDYATVYVNGEYAGTLNRMTKTYDMQIDVPFNATLQILVENLGRINYGAEMIHNLKGITGAVKIADQEITGNWEMRSLPMSEAPDLTKWDGNAMDNKGAAAGQLTSLPTVYAGEFTLTKTGDTFLNMEQFSKGIVFVNGHNLGRFWNAGPQQTLYMPGCWLRQGTNSIVIFDQLNRTPQTEVSGVTKPVLDRLKPENLK